MRDDFLRGGRLVLDELDIRHLSARRRRNQEEEGKNETADQNREVKYVRSARCFGHLDDIFGIDVLALNKGGMIVGISGCVGDKGQEKTDNNDGGWTSHLSLSQ